MTTPSAAAAEKTVAEDEAKKKRKEAMKGEEEPGDNIKQKKKKEDGCSSGERNSVFGIAPPVLHPDILGYTLYYQATIPPEFLFRKTLVYADVGRWVKVLTIPPVLCGRLLTGLSIAGNGDYVELFARDAINGAYVLQLNKPTADYSVGGKSWAKVVRDNGLKVGDTVEGWGIRVTHRIEMSLLIFKN